MKCVCGYEGEDFEDEGDICPDCGREFGETREIKTTCDACEKNLYEDDRCWGNNQTGTYCEKCAEDYIAEWWRTIY